MATLTLKTKVEDRSKVRIPQIRLGHVDSLHELRTHKRLGSLANSNLIEAALSRYIHNVLEIPRVLDLDALPAGVIVEEGSLLINITIEF